MQRVIILIIFLLSITNLVNAQNQIAGYKGGNDSLIRKVTKNLMKGESTVEWGDSSLFVIAFFEVDEKGGNRKHDNNFDKGYYLYKYCCECSNEYKGQLV